MVMPEWSLSEFIFWKDFCITQHFADWSDIVLNIRVQWIFIVDTWQCSRYIAGVATQTRPPIQESTQESNARHTQQTYTGSWMWVFIIYMSIWNQIVRIDIYSLWLSIYWAGDDNYQATSTALYLSLRWVNGVGI